MKFLTETFNRFFKTSPTYFKVIQWISGVVAAVTSIPLLLTQFQTELGIVLPDWVNTVSSKAVLWAAIITWVIAKLPVAHVQDSQMPFTAAQNDKPVIK